MMVPSAAMRRLHREGLEISRRRAALAPTGGVAVAKSPHRRHRIRACSLCRRRCHVSARSACRRRPPCAASSRSLHAAVEVTSRGMRIGKGAQVRVRTRVGVARSTGQPIVFWLRAVVDSTADKDSYLHVTYSRMSSKLPRIARVARSDVRLHDVPPADAHSSCTAASTAGSSSAVTDNSSARPPQKNKAAPPPRPTVAGKKPPLLKKFEKEMKSRSKAIIGCW